MKDFLLIDSVFPTNFWAKVIETINHFYNCLLTKTKSYEELFPKEK